MLPERKRVEIQCAQVGDLSARHAFTLIEVLAVVAIIALVFGLSHGLIHAGQQRAAVARAKVELAAIATALEDFRRHYGDYPWGVPVMDGEHRVGATTGPGETSAAAALFNALTGAGGPRGFGSGRINGPTFIAVERLATEYPLDRTIFAVASGTPPAKPWLNNSFLDPWGSRYIYAYRGPGGGTGAWVAPGYVLYSAGPDGAVSTSPDSSGRFASGERLAGANADNLHSDAPP